MKQAAQRIERIDGTDYVVGSVAHTHALETRNARLDALFLQQNHRLYEEAQRMLRDWDQFHHRADANLVAFFGQQLVFMRARVERVLREKLRMREFVQMETGYPRGAESYGQQVDDHRGEARVGRLMTDDATSVDVESSVSFSPFLWVYSNYNWTAEELDAASYAGVPLLNRKAEAMADAIARKLETLGRSGDAVHNFKGFFNSDLVTLHTLTFGEHLGAATAAEMIADLNEIESTLVTACGDHTPEEYALLVPTLLDHKYRTTMISSTSDLSVADWFFGNGADIKGKSRRFKRLEPLGFLDDAVSPNVAAADAPMSMAVPVRPGTTLAELENVLWPTSVEYEELPPVMEGYRFRRRGQARVAGIDFRHPKRFLYIQNND
jgi:hypothetical protein